MGQGFRLKSQMQAGDWLEGLAGGTALAITWSEIPGRHEAEMHGFTTPGAVANHPLGISRD